MNTSYRRCKIVTEILKVLLYWRSNQMTDVNLDNHHIKKLNSFIYLRSPYFSLIFIFISIFILFFPMTGILDLPYSLSIILISVFILATVFSAISKNLFSNILLITNILLMLSMIFLGPWNKRTCFLSHNSSS